MKRAILIHQLMIFEEYLNLKWNSYQDMMKYVCMVERSRQIKALQELQIKEFDRS